MDSSRVPKVSYCTACHGRLWQLALTLFDNLNRLRDDEELVLLDYGSRDGLGRFVESSKRCRRAIERGQLLYAHTEAASYHGPKARNLAHRLARGDLLVNLDPDQSNQGVRRLINQCFAGGRRNLALDIEDGQAHGSCGRICVPRYWFYRLGGYDESFLPEGYHDSDFLQRAEALGLQCLSVAAGPAAPIQTRKLDTATRSEEHRRRAMWKTNRAASRRNLKEGRLAANPQGWGEAAMGLNFGAPEMLDAMPPAQISIVMLGSDRVSKVNRLLELYNRMPLVGEIFLINSKAGSALEKVDRPDSKVIVVNASAALGMFCRFAVAAQASLPAVLLTDAAIFLPEATLCELHKGWSKDPAILHGVLDGQARPKPSKGKIVRPCEVVPARGVLTTVADCFRCLCHSSRFNSELPGNQNGHDEDILLSFVVANASGRLNLGYRLPTEELAAPKPLSPMGRKRFLEHRSAVVNWCRHSVLEPVPSARRRWRRVKKIGVVATQQRREEQLRQMLATMIQQPLDRRIVYLNDYDTIPDWLAEMSGVEAWLHPSGDLGASAKFILAEEWDGYYFTMDDDILYPASYCEKMARAIERYDRQAIVCAHANILHPNLTHYTQRTPFPFRAALPQDTPVHLAGTGTLAFHAPSIGVGLGDFPLRNLDDPQLGAFCQRYHIPIICVARPANWMTPIKVDRGIYEDIMRDDSQMVTVIKACEPWRIHYPKNWRGN